MTDPKPEPEIILTGGRPIERQIAEQVRDHIRSGPLRPGEELPSVRALAVGLEVNPRVVTQAYELLEAEHYLTTADGSGVLVAPAGSFGIVAPRRETS